MTYNLIRERWLPVRTRSGARRWIRPAEILSDLDGDPAVTPDWPRGDFNTATYELLIGLLSVAAPPAAHEDWVERYRRPPPVETLDAAFATIAHAFDLDGDGPRFCQEFGGLEGDPGPIESLLIDSPGANGQKKNADLLTHRGRYPALSMPAAAMALYTLQIYAPSGGAGIMTSLRGGGPLTTLVAPGEDEEGPLLWRTLWANVGLGATPDPSAHPKIFPWLAPKIETGKTDRLAQDDAVRTHPLQAFFGSPRRLRLVFGDEAGVCPLLGDPFDGGATAVIQRPGGVGYGLWDHPLTPYRRQKEAEAPYTTKPKPGRFGYRNWVAAVVGDASGKLHHPARCVNVARTEREGVLSGSARQPRIRLAGWAMNNMEAQSYLEAEEPLHLASEPGHSEDLDKAARAMAQAGESVHGWLRSALKAAVFSGGDKVDTDKGLFETARLDFFDATDGPFHEILAEAASLTADAYWNAPEARGVAWLRALRKAALTVFDDAAPLLLADPRKAERIVGARALLDRTLRGYGKAGRPLFSSLGVPPPSQKETAA